MKFYYGCSTGETGQYGVGDVVRGTQWTKTDDGYELDGEPVYNVWFIKDDHIEYVD